MNFLYPADGSPKNLLQSRLFLLAAVFLLLYSTVLCLSPAVRLHSWAVELRWTHWIGLLVWLVSTVALHRISIRRLPDRDPYLLPVTALLSGWGLLTIWRLDASFGLRQTMWLAVSFFTLGLILLQPPFLAQLRRYKYLWLTSGLAITAATFVFGTYPGGEGPRLWLGCCGVYFQPSEPLKLLLVIYLAAYLADFTWIKVRLGSLLLPTIFLTGFALLVLAAQRDLGTAALMFVLYAAFIFLATGKRRFLAISLLLILLAGVLGYQVFEVIRIRIDAWIDPWKDATGHAYQIIQSLVAIASGSVFGSGPGIGSPVVVPVALSDFVFAAIAEETGLFGTTGLVILFGLLAVRGLLAALRASNAYHRFLAAGITLNLVIQSILIMGGNLRLFPLTGVTLPFVSYGGSSLLTSLVSLAILLLISNHPVDEISPLTSTRPYFMVGTLLLIGLLAVGSFNTLWASMLQSSLLNRADNPRWAVTENYVPRGQIVDRNNLPITITTGEPGSYGRLLLYPELSPVIGFSNPIYGQAGLERSLDGYLRGTEGQPSSTIETYRLLFNQTPPGLDLRLSIDLRIQQIADELLKDKAGALVLLNSDTGEILAMSSQPGYDANRLNQDWQVLVQDQRGVMLNRATQGVYPPGAALAPFLFAQYLSLSSLPGTVSQTALTTAGARWDCAIPLPQTVSWGALIKNGCPGAINEIVRNLRSDQTLLLLHQLGFDRTPEITLPVSAASSFPSQDEMAQIEQSQFKILVSPLQMALAASALNPHGKIPALRIAASISSPSGWVALPGATQPMQPNIAARDTATRMLQMENLPAWSVVANAQARDQIITWFIAGTMSDWQHAHYALALVLETNDPASASNIGEQLLKRVLQP